MLRTNQHQPAASAPATSQEQAPARTMAEAWSARPSWGSQGHAPVVAGAAAQLRTIAREYPALGYIGFMVAGQTPEAFAPERRTLVAPGAVDEFARALAWLRRAPLRHAKTRGLSSYGLKHMAADDGAGYIGNGPFIAACIAAGFTVTPSQAPGSPNAVVWARLPRNRKKR